LAIAVVAIGIFALPNTVSMFGGQHNWYDLSAAGNDVPCEKCHGDVADEMASTGAHANIKCEGCHRTDARVGYAGAGDWGYGHEVYPGQEAHAASTQECMICHDGRQLGSGTNFTHYNLGHECGGCHGTPWIAPPAGGFNLTGTRDFYNNPDDTGEKAAHLKFVHDAINEPLMEGANEACITCHTHVAIDINWTKEYNMGLTVAADHEGNWTVGNFKSEGTYNVATYGNMSGGTAWSNVTNITWANGSMVSNP